MPSGSTVQKNDFDASQFPRLSTYKLSVLWGKLSSSMIKYRNMENLGFHIQC